jgi:hypothetical protein
MREGRNACINIFENPKEVRPFGRPTSNSK